MPRDLEHATDATQRNNPCHCPTAQLGRGRALLYRQARNPASCAPRSRRPWVIDFTPSSGQPADFLTGWVGGTDPLRHLKLCFPTLEAALAYARRIGIEPNVRSEPPFRPPRAPKTAANLADIQNIPWQDYLAAERAVGRSADDHRPSDQEPMGDGADPWAVLRSPLLDYAEKRARLEDLRLGALAAERAQNEGMPGDATPALADVEAAISGLDWIESCILFVAGMPRHRTA